MKQLLLITALFTLTALAEDPITNSKDGKWDKTKQVINTTADKIDSGTRKVIKQTKTKFKEKKAERESAKATEHAHDHKHEHIEEKSD